MKKTNGTKVKPSVTPPVKIKAVPASRKSEVTSQVHPSEIPLKDIVPSPFNYRYIEEKQDDTSLQELAASIKLHHVLQAILVRPIEENKYEVVVGERRFRASGMAGKDSIPAVIRELTDDQVREIQLIENLHREDPHPMTEAMAIGHLMELPHIKGNVDEVARRLGRSKTFVYARLKLTNLNVYFTPMYLTNVITTKQALRVALLDRQVQQELFEEYCMDWESDGWSFRRLGHAIDALELDLSEAPFDIKDKKLDKKAGACISCQYNTATTASLFPEEEKEARCLNRSCYENKSQAFTKLKLIAVLLANPDLPIAVSDESDLTQYFENDDKHIKGRTVLVDGVDYGYYDEAPEPPKREDYTDYEEEEGNEAEYQEAVGYYNDELEDLEKEVAQGNYSKAILIDGRDIGTIVYLHKKEERSASNYSQAVYHAPAETKAKDYQEAVKAKTLTTEMIEGEKQRLLKREERSKELDEEKLQEAFYEALKKSNAIKEVDTPAGFNDHAVFVFLVYESLSGQAKHDVEELLTLDENDSETHSQRLIRFFFEANENQLSLMTRIGILDDASAKDPRSLRAKMLRLLVETTPGLNADILVTMQRQTTEEREEKLSEKLSQLKRQEEKLAAKAGKQESPTNPNSIGDEIVQTDEIEPAA